MIFDRSVKNTIVLYAFCYARKQLKVDCRTKYGDASLKSILHSYAHAFRFCFTLSCADEAGALALTHTDFGASTGATSGTYRFNYETRRQEFLDCDERNKQ